MKKINKTIVILLSLGTVWSSCSKYHALEYAVDKPEKVIEQEDINAYNPLKSYLDKEANPGFKLGVALNINDYLSKGVLYRLSNRNFEEMVMGYEMKHGSIVRADGSLNLSRVEQLITSAQENNMALYGHTLCWHSGQNAAYLNKLIAPVEIPGSDGPALAGHALKMTNPSVVNPWEAQTAYAINSTEVGKEYVLKIVARGNKAGNLSIDLQTSSNYTGDNMGSLALTTSYKEYELKATATAERDRFIINFGQYDGTIFIDKVVLTKTGSSANLIANGDFESNIDGWGGWGNNSTRAQSADGEGYGSPGGYIIEKTPAEKETILTKALETFIAGMLEKTKGYIKAWDVVNEPMSDWPDQYALKTGIGKTDLADDEFYWQDYLGKDYAVKAFQLARKYGNANDLLFINDYGLEGSGNKCKGLIAYVSYIESKGVKVDGIGTQMHIDINTSKDNIVSMFNLLASTGKMIKVSELDIGLGNGIKTSNATAEMYQKQADLYRYVVEKYLEIIPKDKQYGITIWSPLDSPDQESSFWRRGEPVGLWTEGFVRKPAYQAVAEALVAKK